MQELLEEIYELSLEPERYQRFATQLDSLLEGATASDDRAFLEDALRSHFDRAYRILDRTSRVGVLGADAAQLVASSADSALISITKSGVVSALSPPAKSLLDVDVGASLNSAFHADSQAGFNQLLNDVTDPAHFAPTLVLTKNSSPLVIMLRAVHAGDELLVHLYGAQWGRHVDQQLANTYGVTPRESHVAQCLYQGQSVKQIALKEHRSVETVRKQLKSLLAKTQSANQAALMRLVSGFLFSQSPDALPRWLHTRAMNFSLKRPNQRTVAYYDTHPHASFDDMRCVVFMHGLIYDPELPTLVHDYLVDELGVRVVGVSRAYFGDTSVPESGVDALQQSARDLEAVLEHLKLKEVVLLGTKSGAEHALYFANRFPEKVSRVLAVSGVKPILEESDISSMPNGVRVVARTARYFPSLLPLLLRASITLIHRGDFSRLAAIGYRTSESDMQFIQSPEVAKRLTRGYRFASQNPTKAFTYEGAVLARARAQDYQHVQCPVAYLHGGEDGVFSAKQIEEYVSRLNNSCLSIVENAGHLLLYSHTQNVIDFLKLHLVENK